MARRIAFFDPVHGVGLSIDAGSGRGWLEDPGGDPARAHCRIDVPRDVLLPEPEPEPGPGSRPASGTLFVPWDDLLRFADGLAELGAVDGTRTVGIGDRFARLSIRIRRDGRLRAETTFTQGHHVRLTLRCETRWDWHFGVRDDLPALADEVRAAVRLGRPAPRS